MTTNNSLHEYTVGRFTSTPSFHFTTFSSLERLKLGHFNSNLQFTLGEVEEKGFITEHFTCYVMTLFQPRRLYITKMNEVRKPNCKGNALDRCFLWNGNNFDSVSLYKISLIG